MQWNGAPLKNEEAGKPVAFIGKRVSVSILAVFRSSPAPA